MFGGAAGSSPTAAGAGAGTSIGTGAPTGANTELSPMARAPPPVRVGSIVLRVAPAAARNSVGSGDGHGSAPNSPTPNGPSTSSNGARGSAGSGGRGTADRYRSSVTATISPPPTATAGSGSGGAGRSGGGGRYPNAAANAAQVLLTRDILLLVFRCLPTRSGVVLRCTRVCKVWNRIGGISSSRVSALSAVWVVTHALLLVFEALVASWADNAHSPLRDVSLNTLCVPLYVLAAVAFPLCVVATVRVAVISRPTADDGDSLCHAALCCADENGEHCCASQRH